MSSTRSNPTYASTPSHLLDALKQLSTCEASRSISDALVKLQIPSGGHVPDLQPFGANPTSAKDRLVGEVFTVQMVDANDSQAPKLDGGHFVDQALPGSIVFISSPHHIKSASLGGLLAAGLHVKGVQAVFIDGRCRDLPEIRTLGMPVWASSHSTLGQSPFTRPSTIQQPLTITHPHWPALTISPHDVLIADLDGVVVVPSAKVEQVVELAIKAKQVDQNCMNDILEGKGIAETFAKHRGKTGKH
ncbi:BZ3500_MvSof-1268-A1-R1_C044g00127 [Microbotryum saponariae]|uniref:BZ3500_MvSof-1268-A1-R1_C044g00127 protein n=1 Tax=Microbotryum saponariae TaxID=289078 RepID=A0A2X0M4V1_9BASI|nr:BZ3500_MvSof-1268-A1-R1_Chr4-4g07562 [Microbotryum saponariae]SDA04165.1 BZ3500_MvSof-1268-A1-R1_C044g00127 [Microbotryum saponariae]SDA07223.1 BZ3501_MvSof-1269-A2-R1_Chr4-3g07270 [Microbotryum saponariae]